MVKLPANGFSLVELVVVLGVLGLMTLAAMWGLRSFNNSQVVTNKQKEMLALLRAAQNRVVNGADGQAVRSVAIPSTAGITVTTSPSYGSLPLICFSHPLVTDLSPIYFCGTCASGQGYLCDAGVARAPASFTISFSKNGLTKSVVIEGSGMRINNIYAQ